MGSSSFGKYRLIAELGQGGMADVFLTVQAGPLGSGFRKLGVVKRLRENLAEEPEFVEMLIEEARIAARLNHPNVVQTNEVGQVGDHYFIAMEYLDGQPLHRLQHRAAQREREWGVAPLSKDTQILIVMDALAGLHHAHELADYDGTPLGIVHRDATPQNIFVTYEGQVKVVDFGIAKAAGRASETKQGIVKGKVRYMSPEHAAGARVDRRADIFSLGVVLWEIAAGRRMWRDMDDPHIVEVLVRGDVPCSPRAVDPSVPEVLDRIIRRALAPKPEDRYPNAEELREHLEDYLAKSGRLVEARRALAPTIGELFRDKRAQIKAVIEKQLAALAEESAVSATFRPAQMPADSASHSTPLAQTYAIDATLDAASGTTSVIDPATTLYSPPTGAPTGPSGAPSAAPDGAPPAASLRPSGRPRTVRPSPWKQRFSGLVMAAAATFVIGGVGTAAIAVRRGQAAPAPPAPATVDEITLRFTATPAGVLVSIDDGPPRATPLELRMPKDGKDHHLRFDAQGHVSKVEVVRFASDIAGFVALEPAAPQPTVVKAAEPAAKTSSVPAPAFAARTRKGTSGATGSDKPEVKAPTEAATPAPGDTANAKAPRHKRLNTQMDDTDPWGNH